MKKWSWQMLPTINRLITILMICLLFTACASGKTGEAKTARVGMHIDALLEFAIEYPLDWEKERLLYRAENRGEVHWRIPGDEDVNLSVTSEPRHEVNTEELLAKTLQGLPGFNVTHREKAKLHHREALHVLGYTSRVNYDLWIIDSSRRTFTLQFSAPPEKIAEYDDVRSEIFLSFISLEPPDATPRTD